jgi:hypothetical protein
VEKTVINRLLDFCGVLDNFEINCMYIRKRDFKDEKQFKRSEDLFTVLYRVTDEKSLMLHLAYFLNEIILKTLQMRTT